jgi:hypothetical protein
MNQTHYDFIKYWVPPRKPFACIHSGELRTVLSLTPRLVAKAKCAFSYRMHTVMVHACPHASVSTTKQRWLCWNGFGARQDAPSCIVRSLLGPGGPQLHLRVGEAATGTARWSYARDPKSVLRASAARSQHVRAVPQGARRAKFFGLNLVKLSGVHHSMRPDSHS